MGTFGTVVNPSHYVEVQDPSTPGQVLRPAAGQTIQARNAEGAVALADITTQDYGYWSATYSGVDLLEVSGDGGVTWVGPLVSAEATASSVTAGATADEALAEAQAAQDAAGAAAVRDVTYTASGDVQPIVRRVQYATNGTSPTLFDAYYQPGGPTGTEYHTFWLNENGSPRCAGGKAADAALKAIGFGVGQTGNTFEVQRYNGAGTGGRTNDFAIGPDGAPRIGPNDVPAALCVVIEAGASAPPAGTPAGTVVIRKQA